MRHYHSSAKFPLPAPHDIILPVQILFLCCHPASDMSFGFIDVKNFSGAGSKGWINMEQAFGYVLMYRAFAYAKTSGSLPYGSIILNNVFRHRNRPFLDLRLMQIIFSQKLPLKWCLYNLCIGADNYAGYFPYIFMPQKYSKSLLNTLYPF